MAKKSLDVQVMATISWGALKTKAVVLGFDLWTIVIQLFMIIIFRREYQKKLAEDNEEKLTKIHRKIKRSTAE